MGMGLDPMGWMQSLLRGGDEDGGPTEHRVLAAGAYLGNPCVYLVCRIRVAAGARGRRSRRASGERIRIYRSGVSIACGDTKPLNCSFKMAWLALDGSRVSYLLWYHDFSEPD